MLKNLLILFLSIITLASCYKPSKEYLAKEEEIAHLRQTITTYCYISAKLDKDKPWNVATIYFDDYHANLNTKSKAVLDNINELMNRCDRNLVIVAHSSNHEEESLHGLEISFNRARVIYNYLLSLHIQQHNMKAVFCSNNVNRFIENNTKAYKYNQRAELVLFPKNINLDIGLLCLPNHTLDYKTKN